MSSLRKVLRSDHIRDDREKNVVRGHALFVRFMERKGLGDCVRYFPESMTLGNLRSATPHELLNKYDIRDSKDRDRIMKIVADSHREDQSDTEVRRWRLYLSKNLGIKGWNFGNFYILRRLRCVLILSGG